MVKNLPAKAGDTEDAAQSLSQEDLLEKAMATHCSIFWCRIPWTEEPGGATRVAHGVSKSQVQLSS